LIEQITVGQNLAEFFNMKWVDVLAALLTPTIALLGVSIAYQQLKTNRINIKEKLFERRIAVYDEVRETLVHIMRSGSGKALDDGTRPDFKLANAWRESRFLFGPEIPEYIGALRNSLIDLQYHEEMMVAKNVDYQTHVSGKHKEIKWLVNQFDPLHQKFSKYLTLDIL
jgi:phage gpG-like protein